MRTLDILTYTQDEKTNTEGYIKISKYIQQNADQLLKESQGGNIITREQIIQRYEQIIDEWDKNPHLKTILPDTYKNICYKLQMLKADVDYKVVDVTKDCVMAGGILMCGAQIMTNNSVYAYTNKYQRRLKKIIKQLNNKQYK